MRVRLAIRVRVLVALCVGVLWTTTASAGEPDFYLTKDCSPGCEIPWQQAIESEWQYEGSDLITEVTNFGGKSDLFDVGDITIDVGLAGVDGDGNPSTHDAAGLQWVWLSNRSPYVGEYHSQITFEFSEPVIGALLSAHDYGAWAPETFRLIATDGAGDVWLSNTLNDGHEVANGSLGVVSEVGIVSIAIEYLHYATLEPSASPFQVNEIQVGPAWVDQTPDADGDGLADDVDNCPSDANPDQEDLDGDQAGDACDDDADGDGDLAETDCDDLDPSRYAGAEELCADGVDNDCDGWVDAEDDGGDCDGDGVDNGADNCVLDPNPGQEDLDGDGAGDPCDTDDDGDGLDDLSDNCPVVANADQADYDGDGAGDVCDHDGDGDGVDDTVDLCHFSAPSDPDAGVPSKGLGKNRWADIDGNGAFDTSGNNPTGRFFTMEDTLGCSCAQIIDHCGYGQGHTMFGCSHGVMDTWTGLYDAAGGPVGACE